MNELIIKTLLVVLCVQIIKVSLEYYKTKKISKEMILSPGGMPSAHSAGVMCLTILIGRNEGFNSSIFALCFIFALVVMYDARGVRKSCGDNTIAINRLKKNKQKLKERLGHTNKEVLIGALLGIIVGFIL